MKILALESSAKAASAAIGADGELIAQYYQCSGLTHSRTLLAMVEDLLKNSETDINSVDAIAIANGPGSFTGVRIGTSAAKGLAWAADKPIIAVSTLESMAYHFCGREDVIVCPVMDARRSQIYNAKFTFCDNIIARLCDDRAISLEELLNEAASDEKKYLFVGDGAVLCYNYFSEHGVSAILAPGHLRFQSAFGVLMAAFTKEPESADDVIPQYLRLSQAERERLARLNKDN